MENGSLGDYLERVVASVILADANGQLRQQLLWQQVSPGSVLLEGLDREANLAIRQVTLAFYLVATPPPIWERLWNWIGRLLGATPSEQQTRRFEIGRPGEGIRVEVIVERGSSGALGARALFSPADDDRLRGAEIRGLPS